MSNEFQEYDFLLDFSAGEGLEDLKEKLIEAIKSEKKIFPVKVGTFSEHDEFGMILSIADKDGHYYGIGQLSCSQNDWVSMAQENGMEIDYGEELSKEEQEEITKELQEDHKKGIDNPFRDKIKEFK